MKIIYGLKGTGKTKSIIECANAAAETAKGHVVFITDNSRCSIDLKIQIRFLNVTGFSIEGEDGFRGFLKGIVAANGDNEYIFVDGVTRITGKPLCELKSVFDAAEMLEKEYGVKFAFTCSANKEDLPEFILKHAE